MCDIFFGIEAGAYVRITVSNRLLRIVFKPGFGIRATFFAIEAGAYAQISVSIRLLGIVSTPVLEFATFLSL